MSGRYHHPPRKVEDDYVLSEKVLGSGFAGNVVLATSRRQQKSRFAGAPNWHKGSTTLSYASGREEHQVAAQQG